MQKPKAPRKRHEVGSTEFRKRVSWFITRAAFCGEVVEVSREGVPEPVAVLVGYEEYMRLTKPAA